MKIYENLKEADKKIRVQRPFATEDLSDLCRDVFTFIEEKGDEGVLHYAKLFDDDRSKSIQPLTLNEKAILSAIDTDLKTAIDRAYANIYAFHAKGKPQGYSVETMKGILCRKEWRAVPSVGLYVPGGSAPLFSSVLMMAIPALIAGNPEVVLCTPPSAAGIPLSIQYAALRCGLETIYPIGGMQAIAAMTFGTESVPKVDKVFGPGNRFVTAAKQYAYGKGIAVDMPAGPSEVLVWGDESTPPSFIAADLLAQAEHGPDAQVIFISPSIELAEEVKEELYAQAADLGRQDQLSASIKNAETWVIPESGEAIDWINTYAPEHLIIAREDAEQWSDRIFNAGSVFLGLNSAESLGDYATGTNHTLPTGGFARAYSGLSVIDFMKSITFQSLTDEGLNAIADTVQIMANAEGLEAHANAVSVRTKMKLKNV